MRTSLTSVLLIGLLIKFQEHSCILPTLGGAPRRDSCRELKLEHEEPDYTNCEDYSLDVDDVENPNTDFDVVGREESVSQKSKLIDSSNNDDEENLESEGTTSAKALNHNKIEIVYSTEATSGRSENYHDYEDLQNMSPYEEYRKTDTENLYALSTKSPFWEGHTENSGQYNKVKLTNEIENNKIKILFPNMSQKVSIDTQFNGLAFTESAVGSSTLAILEAKELNESDLQNNHKNQNISPLLTMWKKEKHNFTMTHSLKIISSTLSDRNSYSSLCRATEPSVNRSNNLLVPRIHSSLRSENSNTTQIQLLLKKSNKGGENRSIQINQLRHIQTNTSKSCIEAKTTTKVAHQIKTTTEVEEGYDDCISLKLPQLKNGTDSNARSVLLLRKNCLQPRNQVQRPPGATAKALQAGDNRIHSLLSFQTKKLAGQILDDMSSTNKANQEILNQLSDFNNNNIVWKRINANFKIVTSPAKPKVRTINHNRQIKKAGADKSIAGKTKLQQQHDQYGEIITGPEFKAVHLQASYKIVESASGPRIGSYSENESTKSNCHYESGIIKSKIATNSTNTVNETESIFNSHSKIGRLINRKFSKKRKKRLQRKLKNSHVNLHNDNLDNLPKNVNIKSQCELEVNESNRNFTNIQSQPGPFISGNQTGPNNNISYYPVVRQRRSPNLSTARNEIPETQHKSAVLKEEVLNGLKRIHRLLRETPEEPNKFDYLEEPESAATDISLSSISPKYERLIAKSITKEIIEKAKGMTEAWQGLQVGSVENVDSIKFPYDEIKDEDDQLEVHPLGKHNKSNKKNCCQLEEQLANFLNWIMSAETEGETRHKRNNINDLAETTGLSDDSWLDPTEPTYTHSSDDHIENDSVHTESVQFMNLMKRSNSKSMDGFEVPEIYHVASGRRLSSI